MNSNDLVSLIEELIGRKIVSSYSLGKIDPAYDGVGYPRVVFDGSETASLKRYPHLSSYQPQPNDRIIMANISKTHVIFGKIGFYDGGGGGSGRLEYIWDGTKLGVKTEDEENYSYVDLKGAKGDTGATGPAGQDGTQGVGIEYDWSGTSLGIKREDETGFTYTDLSSGLGNRETPWQNAVLENGWENYGGSFTPAQYKRDVSNFVTLRGLIRNGDVGSVIFTLPVGFRPTGSEIHYINGGGSNYKTVTWGDLYNQDLTRVDIKSDGTVKVTAHTNSWISLSGLRFSIE
jgi:hypothetical protein